MEHNDLSNAYFIDNADKTVIFIIGYEATKEV